MSRTNTGRPEFRLRFGYPTIEFERVGAPTRSVALDAGDPAPTLRGFAAEVARVGGRLTALLPEAEVWRGRVGVSDAAAVARRAAAAQLGATPAALEVALGPVRPDGLRAAAAVKRRSLAEARAFLARAGLKPHRLSAAGAFPGFAGPPVFRTRAWPVALDTIGGHRRAAAGAGLAATLALLLWLGPWQAEAPAPVAVAPAPIAATPPAIVAQPAPPRAEIAPLQRPADLPSPVPATRLAAEPELVTVGLAGRNMPADIVPPPPATMRPAATATLGARDLPRPRPAAPEPAPSADATALDGAEGPRPRPVAPRAAATVPAPAAVVPAPAADAGSHGDGPRPRPAARSQIAAAAPAVATARPASRGGPEPRPAGLQAARSVVEVAPMVIAALAPQAASAGLAAAAVAPPAPRRLPVAAPVATRPAAAQPVLAAPAPVRVARLEPPAQPVRAAAPTPARATPQVRAAPQVRAVAPAATQSRVAPQAQPVRQARVQAAPQPTRARQSGLRGNSLALIGIFGNANGRHALVQLPNGATERVRAGDEFQGVQVTAVAADGVHLRAQGRESVLRLPD